MDISKYLRIPQTNGTLEEAAGKSATANYLQRIRQVLRSRDRTRSGQSTPTPRTINWLKEETEATELGENAPP